MTTSTDSEILVAAGESVQAALDTAGEGTVVRLGEGTFAENLSVTTSGVRLVGAGSGRTVLVPGATTTATSIPPLHDAPADVVSGIALHGVRDIAIEGLTVRGFSGAGVYAHSCHGVRLTDVEADGDRVWGLYLRESADLRVESCSARGSQYAGVAFAFCAAADGVVTGTEATGSAFGVFVDNSSGVRVVGNRCHGNAAGILLLHQTYEGELPGGVRDCLVSDNDVRANTLAAGGEAPDALGAAGPPISGVGIAAIGTQRVTVVGNHVHDHRPTGETVMPGAVVLASSADWGGSDAVDNTLEWNTITGNEPFDALVATDPSAQRFRNNVIGTSEPAQLDDHAPQGTV
ncbi:right-handed parallel beta-helix repeat-containing protein [Prauserella rugosa]|uniref:Parallel beta-helix repeat protein n=1 Tax=Prauserella rugosa TaxID=43354 RepID=A0A660CCY6_9PSEU|nr:right-handed parallel beta-helix repeat-containing protein [Prauserella rugosa]KMS90415.1 nitrous oxidase accessory protein [Streptomyces regensis]TWH20264.1 parallel beta-helix repeat protein [Prauserella rugosa]